MNTYPSIESYKPPLTEKSLKKLPGRVIRAFVKVAFWYVKQSNKGYCSKIPQEILDALKIIKRTENPNGNGKTFTGSDFVIRVENLMAK